MNCKETKIQLLLKSAKEGNEDIFKDYWMATGA